MKCVLLQLHSDPHFVCTCGSSLLKGQVLLIENTRATNPLLGYYQDLTASIAADVGGKGCLYNQNVGEMIQQTNGLKLVKEEAFAAGLFRSFVCEKI